MSEVAILSGPRARHAELRAALQHCLRSATDGTGAVQDFNVKVG